MISRRAEEETALMERLRRRLDLLWKESDRNMRSCEELTAPKSEESIAEAKDASEHSLSS